MKLFPWTVIAHLGVVWALPSQAESQALYIPCSSDTCSSGIFNTAYCCERGLLGDVSECQPREGTISIACLMVLLTFPTALIPLSDQNFQDQCAFLQKSAVCCIPPALLTPPTLCIPLLT
ncbi:hypothetical protein F5Y10DRAFT_192514 [Nemania abortiva]|nr:hypothetical protein F5Y10DRAFT_192514 [Nemania abortiva]